MSNPDDESKTAHPAPELLEKFMRSEARPAERRRVVRHLIAGCAECVAFTRQLWGLGERPAREHRRQAGLGSPEGAAAQLQPETETFEAQRPARPAHSLPAIEGRAAVEPLAPHPRLPAAADRRGLRNVASPAPAHAAHAAHPPHPLHPLNTEHDAAPPVPAGAYGDVFARLAEVGRRIDLEREAAPGLTEELLASSPGERAALLEGLPLRLRETAAASGGDAAGRIGAGAAGAGASAPGSGARFLTPSVCELLLDRSREAADLEPTRALLLAELALAVAERLDVAVCGAIVVTGLRVRAWAHLGHARRLAGDLDGAEWALAMADALVLGAPRALAAQDAAAGLAAPRVPAAAGWLATGDDFDPLAAFTMLSARPALHALPAEEPAGSPDPLSLPPVGAGAPADPDLDLGPLPESLSALATLASLRAAVPAVLEPGEWAEVLAFKAGLFAERGDLVEADRLLERAVSLYRGSSAPSLAGRTLVQQGEVRAEMGYAAAAIDLLRAAVDLLAPPAGPTEPRLAAATLCRLAALLCADLPTPYAPPSRSAATAATAATPATSANTAPAPAGTGPGGSAAAAAIDPQGAADPEAAAAAGRAVEALAALGRARALYRRLEDACAEARVCRLQGQLQAALGRLEEAAETLRAAQAVLARHGLGREASSALVDLALVLARQQRGAEVRRLEHDHSVLLRVRDHGWEWYLAVWVFQIQAAHDPCNTGMLAELARYLAARPLHMPHAGVLGRGSRRLGRVA